MSDLLNNFDMLIPPEMAVKAENAGVTKASLGWRNMFLLAILAGAFISLGAIFATIVTTGAGQQLPYGVVRLIGGLVFCLGLILGDFFMAGFWSIIGPIAGNIVYQIFP